jgi:hypothetical protein
MELLRRNDYSLVPSNSSSITHHRGSFENSDPESDPEERTHMLGNNNNYNMNVPTRLDARPDGATSSSPSNTSIFECISMMFHRDARGPRSFRSVVTAKYWKQWAVVIAVVFAFQLCSTFFLCKIGCGSSSLSLFPSPLCNSLCLMSGGSGSSAASLSTIVVSSKANPKLSTGTVNDNTAADICVYLTHYHNRKWLDLNLQNLRRLAADADRVEFVVLTMEPGQGTRDEVADIVGRRATVVHAPCGGVGGGPLLCLFEVAATLSSCEITVMIDVDAVVMYNGWDRVLRTIYKDPSIAVAGINPRGKTQGVPIVITPEVFQQRQQMKEPEAKHCFDTVPEWNWLSYRTKVLRDHIVHKLTHLERTGEWTWCDHGTYFARAATEAGKNVYRFPYLYHPFKHSSPIVVQYDGTPFVYHNFYSTRRENDKIPKSEQEWLPSQNQDQCVFTWLASSSTHELPKCASGDVQVNT